MTHDITGGVSWSGGGGGGEELKFCGAGEGLLCKARSGLQTLLHGNERKVIPIEAKSGKTFAIKSLQNFKTKFSNRVGLQYVLYDGDIKRDGEIVYLPYYIAAVL